MPKQISNLALKVMQDYDKANRAKEPEKLEQIIHRRSSYNASIPVICKEEGITTGAVKKCISKAKTRVAMRLYIITELERLKNLFGDAVSDEDIDEIISDSLSNLIKNGQFGTLLKETVLS